PLVRVPSIRITKALVRAEVVAVSVFAPLLPVIDRHRCASSVPRTQTQTRPPPAAVSPSGDLVRCVAGKVRGRRRTARESRARSSPPAHGRAAGPPCAKVLSLAHHRRPRERLFGFPAIGH